MSREGLISGAVASPATRRQFLGQVVTGLGSAALMGLPGRLAFGQPITLPKLPTALVYDGICKSHLTGPDAPERPQRYDAVLTALSKTAYFSELLPVKARMATDAEIRACHVTTYMSLARREIESGAKKLSTGDTRICRDSLKCAYYAAGSACVAVDAVMSGKAKNSFCLTRPPGHHATADRGMGFCIFNNVGIAARYAQRRYRIGKVLIIDWDVHHGNGTQDIFYEDGTVFFFSTHQSPWYPWTGTVEETGHGQGLGATLNCPMLKGSGRREYLSAFLDRLAPAVDRFKPELILLSAGFDARMGDPLGRMQLTDQDYIDLTGVVMEMARNHAGGRLVSILEGGYSLTGLAAGAAAHCSRLQQG